MPRSFTTFTSSPKNTDFLICLTDNDQDNIIASLIDQRVGLGQVMSNTEKKLDTLDLHKETQIVCISRGDKAYLASNSEMLKEDDIVTLITNQDKIASLSKKFGLPKQTKTENKGRVI